MYARKACRRASFAYIPHVSSLFFFSHSIAQNETERVLQLLPSNLNSIFFSYYFSFPFIE